MKPFKRTKTKLLRKVTFIPHGGLQGLEGWLLRRKHPSPRGPRFTSQHRRRLTTPCTSSRGPVLSSGFWEHLTSQVHKATHTHKIKTGNLKSQLHVSYYRRMDPYILILKIIKPKLIRVWRGAWVPHVWRSEDNFVLFLGVKLRSPGFHGKCLNCLSHLKKSSWFFFSSKSTPALPESKGGRDTSVSSHFWSKQNQAKLAVFSFFHLFI